MMDTPPPLPAASPQKSAFHTLATVSIAAVLGAVALTMLGHAGIALTGSFHPKASIVISAISGLLMLGGALAGVVALCGIPRHGARGILIKSLVGLGIPMVFVVMAIPSLLNVTEKAKQMTSDAVVQQQLKLVEQAMKATLPKQIDEMTTLERMEAAPGRWLINSYRVTGIEASKIAREQFEAMMRPDLVARYRDQEDTKRLREMKVNIRHHYVDASGALLGEVEVGPQDLLPQATAQKETPEVTDDAIDQRLKLIEAAMKVQLPIQADEITTLERVEAAPGRWLIYSYTIKDVEASKTSREQFEALMRPELVALYRDQDDTKDLRDMKTRLLHRYTDPSGALLGEITVGPEDLPKAPAVKAP